MYNTDSHIIQTRGYLDAVTFEGINMYYVSFLAPNQLCRSYPTIYKAEKEGRVFSWPLLHVLLACGYLCNNKALPHRGERLPSPLIPPWQWHITPNQGFVFVLELVVVIHTTNDCHDMHTCYQRKAGGWGRSEPGLLRVSILLEIVRSSAGYRTGTCTVGGGGGGWGVPSII